MLVRVEKGSSMMRGRRRVTSFSAFRAKARIVPSPRPAGHWCPVLSISLLSCFVRAPSRRPLMHTQETARPHWTDRVS
jgi:hypothetical protein